MRKLSPQPEDTIIEVSDVVGDCVHVVRARQPTDRERFLYEANRFRRKGNTIYDRLPEQRRAYGRKVLTGFAKGTFGDEEGNPVSSDPEDPDYREDWAELIDSSFPELFDVVAKVMFESTRTVPRRTGKDDPENLHVVYGDDPEPAEQEDEPGAADGADSPAEDKVAEVIDRPLESSSSGRSE